MIEIIIIWRLTVYIGNIANQKGLKKIGYQVMAVLLWICGELVGGMLGTIIFGAESSFWLRYVAALVGAIVGAGTAFLIMRLIPNQGTVLHPAQTETWQVSPSAKQFGRSPWIPVLIGLVAFSCICLVGAWAMFSAQVRSLAQQIHATDPIIGIEVDNSGQIVQPINEISSKANAIYFGFNFEIPQGTEIPVTFDVYIDGKMAYSFSETLSRGQIVVPIEKYELQEFNKGNYKVIAHMGELLLTSAELVVK